MTDQKCPFFNQCGGCSSQHISYEMQVDNKAKQLASFIGVQKDTIQVFSDKEFHYRNRMDFIFHPRGLGLRQKGDWKHIVDIDRCIISDERLNVLLKEVREYFKSVDAFDVRRHNGTYRYAVIRTPTNDSSISFVLNDDSTRLGDAVGKIKEFAKHTTANNIAITYVPAQTDMSISSEFYMVKGIDMLNEDYLTKKFKYSVQGFFQNNTLMAEKMQEYVNGVLQKYETPDHTLLDLYCGVGTFGICNSKLFKNVVMVESDQNCIDAAILNIKENDATNCEAILLDATNIKKLEMSEKLFIITDPPRSGMHPKTIEQIKKLKPKVMIYISCNIQQLGKDLEKFKGYNIKSVAMFDLFPQTPHVEAIVELVII
jgi:23S rRNA (uracil1939-C5)-methyltransferase